jgi:hypothetical protein
MRSSHTLSAVSSSESLLASGDGYIVGVQHGGDGAEVAYSEDKFRWPIFT